MENSWMPGGMKDAAIARMDANGLRFEVAQPGAGDHLAFRLHGFSELNYSLLHQMPLLAKMEDGL